MDQPTPPTKRRPRGRRRKSSFLHMRTTRLRRAVVLGFLSRLSTTGSPATITGVVEHVFDAGVEALRGAGVVPEAIEERFLDDAMKLSDARAAILRAHGHDVGPEEDDGPDADNADVSKPLHRT